MSGQRKVDLLWEAGINPYPNDYRPNHTAATGVWKG